MTLRTWTFVICSAALTGATFMACGGDDTSGASTSDGGSDTSTPDTGTGGDASPGDSGPDSSACIFDGGASTLLNDAIQIAVGTIGACAIRVDHSLVCWGSNEFDYIGQPASVTASARPITPAFPTDAGTLHFSSVGAGNGNMCALDTDGHVWCWGYSGAGECGIGTSSTTVLPSMVIDRNGAPLHDIVTLGVARHAGCALRSDDVMFCWGDNVFGELVGSDAGSTSLSAIETPIPSVGTTSTTLTSSSYADHICMHGATGDVCWGDNTNVELADPNMPSHLNAAVGAALVDGGASAPPSEFMTDYQQSCAIDGAKHVYCWGQNQGAFNGAIAYGAQTAVPLQVPGAPAMVMRAATGSAAMCAIDGAGTLTCWGYNGNGELGGGAGTMDGGFSSPGAVVGVGGSGTLPPAIDVRIGNFACAIVGGACGAGQVVCWGSSFGGALGTDAGDSVVPYPLEIPAPNPDGGL